MTAAHEVTRSLRRLARATPFQNVQRHLQLSLVELDVTHDAIGKTVDARESILAYLEARLDSIVAEAEALAAVKTWLKDQCKYEKRRRFTVHAEAGLMALLNSLHGAGLGDVVQEYGALKELAEVCG